MTNKNERYSTLPAIKKLQIKVTLKFCMSFVGLEEKADVQLLTSCVSQNGNEL
jgi:hypothetical protein